MSDKQSESEALSDWLDADQSGRGVDHGSAGDADHLADALVVHGLLRDLSRHDDAIEEHRITRLLGQLEQKEKTRDSSPSDSQSTGPRDDKVQQITSRRFLALAGGAGLAACLLIALFVIRPGALSAAEALERIIQSAAKQVDRTYEIHVLEEYQQRRKPKNLSERQWLAESNENLDGARLYVGGADRYVFVRALTDGREKKSGCDGAESWAFREDGPVHVSDDLARFRGKVPGQQQSIAFADLYSQLISLRDGYDVDLSETTDRDSQIRRLVGHRKSREVRGPKTIEFFFDRNDGTIHRMILDGLPRGHGGPKSVEFVLVSQESLDDGFYSHGFHHDGRRKIKREDAQP